MADDAGRLLIGVKYYLHPRSWLMLPVFPSVIPSD